MTFTLGCAVAIVALARRRQDPRSYKEFYPVSRAQGALSRRTTLSGFPPAGWAGIRLTPDNYRGHIMIFMKIESH